MGLLLLVAAAPGAAGLDRPLPHPASRHTPQFPPLAHTGGFGEPTCAQCHFGNPENEPAGTLTLEGVPDGYVPGKRYRLVVRLSRPGMERAGFQLAARYAEGPAAGRQAGELGGTGERVDVQPWPATGVRYAFHTAPGTAVAGDSARWEVEWIAPAAADAPVVIHLVGNAADDDQSPLGDHIYTAQRVIRPRR